MALLLSAPLFMNARSTSVRNHDLVLEFICVCIRQAAHYLDPTHRPILDYLKVLVVDEYDECIKSNLLAMTLLLSAACQQNASGSKPQVRWEHTGTC